MSLRQQNKARVRANILRTAQALILEQGVEQTTTRQIAQRAGISYQTLYNYFPSKTKLLSGLLAADSDRWGATIDDCIKQYSGNLLRTLTEINKVSVEQFSGEKHELWREICAAIFSQDFDGGQFAALNQMAHERYYALLSMAQGTGELGRTVDLHLLAHTLFCLTDYAFITFLLTGPGNAEVFLTNLDQQLALVVVPYLVESESTGEAHTVLG